MKKSITTHISKVFDHRARLGIMSILAVNDSVNFNDLKQMLSLTDGSLAGHIKVLEKHKYIVVSKEFVQRKPQTSYAISEDGTTAFKAHLEILEALIKQTEQKQ